MKVKQIFQVFILLIVVVVLYCFAINRNAQRTLVNTTVEFTNGEHLFLTAETVNNLLIANKKNDSILRLDSLDLNKVEQQLLTNPLIADVQVYRTVTNTLGIEVTQREPIARVIGQHSFYIDKKGQKMPLSTHYTARVPLVAGVVDSSDVAEVFPLLQKIQKDEFLKQHITAVEKKKKTGDYILRLRQNQMTIIFGGITDLNIKINNLKAFFKKAYQDQLLEQYTQINLKFTNQVVCTKKEA